MRNNKHELPMVVQNDNVLVDARLLHRQLKVGKDFSNWIKNRIKEFGFEEGKDYSPNLASKIGKHGGSNAIDYLLSMDMAKELAMLERNETGRQIRRYFIAKEKELRGISQLPSQAGLFNGLKANTINGRKLYGYKEVRQRLGYSSNASYNKYRYPHHFVENGSVLLCTEEFCNHMRFCKMATTNRKALAAMPPVLPQVAHPLQLPFNQQKGGTHA